MTADSSAGASLLVACPQCATKNRVSSTRVGDGATCGNCRQPLFPGHSFALTAQTFNRHIEGDAPVVVDFWAEWCGPCRMMAPAYEQAAARVPPGVHLAKLDTEAAPEIAARFGIRSIPTLILYRDGKEIARRAGASDYGSLAQWLAASLR